MNRAFEFFEKDKAPEWEPRNTYFDFYKTLNTLKHKHPALAAGSARGGKMLRYATKSPDLYVFERQLGNDRVVVALNLGKADAPVSFTGAKPDTASLTDIFTGKAGAIPATLTPGQYVVLATE